jgi:hypothetical protein
LNITHKNDPFRISYRVLQVCVINYLGVHKGNSDGLLSQSQLLRLSLSQNGHLKHWEKTKRKKDDGPDDSTTEILQQDHRIAPPMDRDMTVRKYRILK